MRLGHLPGQILPIVQNASAAPTVSTTPGAGTSSTFLAAAATVALARSVVREIMLVTGGREPAESRASQRMLFLGGL